MNPLGILLTLVCSFFIYSGTRRVAALALFAGTCYITQGQSITVAGFHFTSIRLIVLIGLFRAFSKGEWAELKLNAIDKALMAYVASTTVLDAIGASFDTSELTYQLGWDYNIVLPYLLFRCLVRDLDDLVELMSGLSFLIIPMALEMLLEAQNGHNWFSLMGGVFPGDMYRDGHFRCSGAFRSPITGGTFGSTLMPFFLGLYLYAPERKREAIIGFVTATVITACSRSSGPLIAYGCALMGFAFWGMREKMKMVRWAVLITIVSLHMMMKAPVWFLLGRISDVVGGGGYHRAYLVDQAVNNFGSWWLCGTHDTGGWMATQLLDGAADLTNQFVAAGVRGGLLSLVIFIVVIVRCFRNLGIAMKQFRGVDQRTELMLWAMGACMFATIVNFFSVSYFDQIDVVWYFLIAAISGVTTQLLNSEADGVVYEEAGEQPEVLQQA